MSATPLLVFTLAATQVMLAAAPENSNGLLIDSWARSLSSPIVIIDFIAELGPGAGLPPPARGSS